MQIRNRLGAAAYLDAANWLATHIMKAPLRREMKPDFKPHIFCDPSIDMYEDEET